MENSFPLFCWLNIHEYTLDEKYVRINLELKCYLPVVFQGKSYTIKTLQIIIDILLLLVATFRIPDKGTAVN